jgi:hypothetical protein
MIVLRPMAEVRAHDSRAGLGRSLTGRQNLGGTGGDGENIFLFANIYLKINFLTSD